MVTTDGPDFKYFAFISYSRKDSRAAAFLHKKLEKFRIPIKRVPEEMRKGLQKFVRPVFRDKRDLEVGESSFTEDVKRALEESRFIIVLCSPNSAQSVWVDNEIKHFLSTHDGDLSKVVPVVLSGNPGSEDPKSECLSACLLSEEARRIIVSRNLPTMIPDEGEPEKAGWEAGVVGVLSYLLKVKRMDIKSTMDAERIRYLRINTIVCVGFSVVFAFLAIWAIKAERFALAAEAQARTNELLAVEQSKQLKRSNGIQSILMKDWWKGHRPKMTLNQCLLHGIPEATKGKSVEGGLLAKYIQDVFERKKKSRIAGPEIIGRMLDAMDIDLQSSINRDARIEKMLLMRSIINDHKKALCQQHTFLEKTKTNTTEMARCLARIYEADKKLKNMDDALQPYVGSQQLRRKVDCYLSSGEVNQALDMIYTNVQWRISRAEWGWHVMSSLNRGLEDVADNGRIFYGVLELEWIKNAVIRNPDIITRPGPVIVAWDFRVAELLLKQTNRNDATYFINEAIEKVAEDISDKFPTITEFYADVDQKLLVEFLHQHDTYESRQRESYESLNDLYVCLRAIRLLSRCNTIYKKQKQPQIGNEHELWQYDDSINERSEVQLWYLGVVLKQLEAALKFHGELKVYLEINGDVKGSRRIEQLLTTGHNIVSWMSH